LTKRSVD